MDHSFKNEGRPPGEPLHKSVTDRFEVSKAQRELTGWPVIDPNARWGNTFLFFYRGTGLLRTSTIANIDEALQLEKLTQS